MPEKREQEIRNLQTFLREIAILDTRIPLLVPDGKFESQTENAVRVFQELNSLSPTGQVDEQTLAKISKQYFEIIDDREIISINVFDSDKNKVYLAQVLLKEIGDRFYNFSEIEITGTKDEKTVLLFEQSALTSTSSCRKIKSAFCRKSNGRRLSKHVKRLQRLQR